MKRLGLSTLETRRKRGDLIETYKVLTGNENIDYKNSSGNEIANVNFYAVRPDATRIR